MSTEQKPPPSSPKPAAKFGNWFLEEDGTLKTQSWTALIILAIIGVVGFIQLGYYVGWTGFQGKTLWDWMQLFLVSTALGAGAYWFNSQQTTHQKTLAEQQQKQEKELAEQREQATIFDTYLDRMKELLLDKGLRSDQEVRLVARTRTLTTLRRLKGEHISMLFTFLQDANLNGANMESAIIDFQNADLRRIDLHEVELRKVDLSGADLREANLSGADLSFARLSRVRLHGADLSGANLSFANLHRAWLRGADLSFANLHGADLSKADLHGADLSGTDLHRADLGGTDLYRADLHGTDLSGADLHRVDLSGANLREAEGLTTEELVSQANSLEGTTLPNGTLYQKESAPDSTEEVPQRVPIGSDEASPESARNFPG
jgi:uncharacterized protein YjbI with pentapeptide repeats